MIEVPAADLMTYAEKTAQDSSDWEWAKKGGKWLYNRDVPAFYKNGIKSAMTIERIRQFRPSQSLHCYVVVYFKDDTASSHHLEKWVNTTTDLEAWLDEANELSAALKNDPNTSGVYICMAFSGREPLNIERLAAFGAGTPVIAKTKYGYVYEINPNGQGYTATKDASMALVFDDVDNALLRLPKGFGFDFVQASIKDRKKPENLFVLCVAEGSRNGWFVQKLTRSKIYWAYSKEDAKLFPTEKAALKWAEDHGIVNAKFGKAVLRVEAQRVKEEAA